MKIDTKEMTHGKEVALELRGKTGGIPWITIIDGDKKRLITSDGPKGNVGCPVKPHEIDWFMTMIDKTSRNLDAKEKKTLRAELTKHAHWIENRKKR